MNNATGEQDLSPRLYSPLPTIKGSSHGSAASLTARAIADSIEAIDGRVWGLESSSPPTSPLFVSPPANAARTVHRHNRSATMLGDIYAMNAITSPTLGGGGRGWDQPRSPPAMTFAPLIMSSADDSSSSEEEEEIVKDRNVVVVSRSRRQHKLQRRVSNEKATTKETVVSWPQQQGRKSPSNQPCSPLTKKKGSSVSKQHVKRNNLVIQLPPLPRVGQGTSWPQRQQQQNQRQSPSRSLSRLPPPHPFSNSLSPPPYTPGAHNKRQPYHGYSNSTGSIMSETSSAAESEVTPRISQVGRSGRGCDRRPLQGDHDRNPILTFSFSDDDDDDNVDDKSDSVVGVGMVDEVEVMMAKDKSKLKRQRPEPIQIPFSELKGIDISFSRKDERDAARAASKTVSADATTTSKRQTSVNKDPLMDHKFEDMSPIKASDNADNRYADGNECFYDDELDEEGNHTRQFSSDDRFFEGIHDSGLQSLSFEQVADADLQTCMDVEIELVYNASSSFGSFEADENMYQERSSVDVEQDRKEMEKRILQWRRGRHAWMMNSEGQQQQQQQQNEKNHELEGNDDVELAPLPSLPAAVCANIMIHDSSAFDAVGINCYNSKYSDEYKSSPPPTAFDDDNEDDNGCEVRGLTSSAIGVPNCRRYSHDADTCRRYRCRALSSMWQLHSVRKLVLLILCCVVFMAWMFMHSNLEVHNDRSNAEENDSWQDADQGLLRKDVFIDRGKHIDDGDDYYESSTSQTLMIDDQNSYELEESVIAKTIASAVSSKSVRQPAQELNKFVGIDTISVLGFCEHPSIDWLVNRLKRLYPDMKVMSGFPTTDNGITKKPKIRTILSNVEHSHLRRVMDASSIKATRHISSDIHPMNSNYAHQKSKGHILVVVVSLNPYAWVEWMRADSQHEPRYSLTNSDDGSLLVWQEYVKAILPSVNGTIFDLRSNSIHSAVVESSQHDGVRVVIPLQFEDLVEPYSNYDNFVLDESLSLPGIVGLLDQIQAQTGLHADESSGWQVATKDKNDFWADPVGCTGHICFPSVNKMTEDVHYVRFMNEHIDWSMEELIGYHPRREPKPSVDQIVVLGERWSGAEWLVDRLARCFPHTPVKYGFSRPGKWFQTNPDPASVPMPRLLVVSVFLNSLDWVENMRQNPINAPAHKGMDWSDFVSSPWVRKRSQLDETLAGTTNATCSFGFSFEEVVPCMTERDPQSDSFPLYELHPASSGSQAGEPYSNLLELRTDKIRNFLSTATFNGVVDLIPVRYEDLVSSEDFSDDNSYSTLPYPGIVGLLEEVRDRTSLVPDIEIISDKDGLFIAEPLGVGAAKLDVNFVQWMDEHVDWDVEMLIGYSP